jgi:hypothetical protein
MQLHPAELRLRCDLVCARRRNAWTCSASCGAVRRHALLSRCLATRGEFVGHMSTASEVHLVGCLPLKRMMRHHFIVRGYVERDELSHGRQIVQ